MIWARMSGAVVVKVGFDKDISKLFEKAGLKSPYAVAKAIDEVGNKTKTQVTRVVAKQAGVKYGKAKGVIASRQAMGAGNGEYQIIARDVFLSRKEFAPKQAAKGISVTTAKRGRIVLKGSFIGPGGHVYARVGKGRLPIKKLWATAIPNEMIKAEAEATFYRVSQEMLGPAVEKWLLRQIG
jgi:hypothetical protein